ncbi:23399_t:CDS:2, partial [Racocetra persica]
DDEYPINTFNNSFTSVSHKLLVVIPSHITEIKARKLMREFMFGIKDNLIPCTEQNGDIYYKFLVKSYRNVDYGMYVLKDFKAEVMEFDDIVEFPKLPNGVDWQKVVLTWISYDYVAIIDEHSVIDLKKLRQILDSSIINNYSMTPKQKSNLVWGRFDNQMSDDMLIVLGRESIDTLLNFDYFTMPNRNETLIEIFTNQISLAYYYFEIENLTNESKLFFINDQIGMIEWSNSVKTIPVEKTIGIGRVYLESDVRNLVVYLSITKSTVCHPIVRENADDVTDNKRRYAKKHGYSFVARSEEYNVQQLYKNRESIWGKIDSIEKVLPHYDW